jgi:hypothetical protein
MSAKMQEALKRHNYVTPTNYLEFVGGYKSLLKEKKASLTDKAGKLRGGMTKLNETAVQVGEMQARVSLSLLVLSIVSSGVVQAGHPNLTLAQGLACKLASDLAACGALAAASVVGVPSKFGLISGACRWWQRRRQWWCPQQRRTARCW